MDNDRLNTILKLVAGLGSAGVSAISPAAGRAVLGGTNMWSNIEENDRRKKEAEAEIERHGREMDIREAEHDQSKRLNDIVIAQKQSEMDAHRNLQRFASEQKTSVERLKGYADMDRMGADVGESDLSAGVDPFSDRAKESYAQANMDLPFEQAALASAEAGDVTGFARAKTDLGQAKTQLKGQTEAYKRMMESQDRSDDRQTRTILASKERQEAGFAHSDEKPSPEDRDFSKKDIALMTKELNGFMDSHPGLTGDSKTDQKTLDAMALKDPSVYKRYEDAIGIARALQEWKARQSGGGASAPAGGEKKTATPEDTLARIDALTK